MSNQGKMQRVVDKLQRVVDKLQRGLENTEIYVTPNRLALGYWDLLGYHTKHTSKYTIVAPVQSGYGMHRENGDFLACTHRAVI